MVTTGGRDGRLVRSAVGGLEPDMSLNEATGQTNSLWRRTVGRYRRQLHHLLQDSGRTPWR
jgi:hypothetical protein